MTKEDVIKLVVPPNLLKQENVCLIPREAEHPSRNKFALVTQKTRRICAQTAPLNIVSTSPTGLTAYTFIVTFFSCLIPCLMGRWVDTGIAMIIVRIIIIVM